MEIAKFGHAIGQFVNRNSTTILSSVAVVGTVSTAIFAGRAGYRHGFDDGFYGKRLDWKDSVKENWSKYIPAAGMGTVTIVAIVGANAIGMRRTTAIAAAYTMTERAFSEYQDKVKEVVGERKEGHIRDEIAKDQMAENPLSNQVVMLGTGEHLCFDTLSGRYFKSEIEKIRRLENDINASILHGQDTISQNDWYSALGIPTLENGDGVGWNDENLMELHIAPHLAEDGTPCIAIGHKNLPTAQFWKVNP